jgi:DNA-binding LytR/AlgR family response regulator
MKVIIIEDEQLTAERLRRLLHDYDPSIQVLEVLPSVAESVDWLRTHNAPDLMLMDIHLEDDLAFAIFEQIPVQTPVIFTTAHDEYMIKAFKVNSIDYLLKPVHAGELAQALDKFRSLRQPAPPPGLEALLQYIGKQPEPAYKSRFMISVGSKIRSIEAAEIAYFYAAEKLTFLVTREGQHLPVEYSLDKLSGLLDPAQFFRVSRQVMVSFPAIQTVHAYYKGRLRLDLLPKPPQEVFVSGDRVADFKDWLGR